MKSLLAFIRKNRWMLLLALIGVLLIRWRMRHDGPERLMDLPEGELIAIENGQLLIDQGGSLSSGSHQLDLISVDAVHGAKRFLLKEQNRLAQIYTPRDGFSNFLYAKPWLYYAVISAPPKLIARADGKRAIAIPPLILRRVHMQNGTTEDVLHFTCDESPVQMTFDPNLVVVSTPPLRLIDNTFYWIAPSSSTFPSERVFVDGQSEPLPHAYSLMCKSPGNRPARAVVNWLSGNRGNFAVQDDRLYWTDEKPEEYQWGKDHRQIIRSIGHTTIWTRHLPDGSPQRLAASLHEGITLMPTPVGLYTRELIPGTDRGTPPRILYFDLSNHCHLVTFAPSLGSVDYRGRIYAPASIDTSIPGLKGVRMGRLLSMRPDGSDRKQLIPAAFPMVVRMGAPVAFQGRLYVTAEVKKSYYDGLAPMPLLAQIEAAPTEHLQPLPRAFGVAGTYFDGDYCYYVKSEERKNWRKWLDDTRAVTNQKVLYRYRLPDRRKSP